MRISDWSSDVCSSDLPTWQIEPDPAKTSEVEVRFVAEGSDRTRVELEHRHLDRHGDGWDSVHDGVDSDGGWPLYLTRYADLFTDRKSYVEGKSGAGRYDLGGRRIIKKTTTNKN